MARQQRALYWIDRAVVCLLAGTLLACGTSSPRPEGGLAGLPALTPSPEPARSASYTNVEYSQGNAVFDTSGDTLFAGSSLVLGSSLSEIGWARYAFNLNGYQPDEAVVGLSTSGNGTAWVALPNYAAGSYDIYGPFTGNTTVDLGELPGHSYISSGGQSYVVVIVSGGASVSIDFVMLRYDNLNSPPLSIAGTILDEHGLPLPGIEVQTNPLFLSAVTDLDGEYFIGVPTADTYDVTPQGSITNHTFMPSTASVVVDGNETGVDFVGSRVDIFGSILDTDGNGIKGVLLTLTPGGATTLSNASGDFIFSNVPSNSYTVTPILATYTFDPPSAAANVVGGDVMGVDFLASGGAPTYTISGLILDGGAPVPSVAVTLTPGYLTAFTDSNGFYKFAGLADQTTYSLTPARTGYTFTPPVLPVPIDGSSVPNQNFAATFHPTYLVAGAVRDPQLAEFIPGVYAVLRRVSDSQIVASDETNSSGVFSFPAVLAGQYKVELTKFGYTKVTTANFAVSGDVTLPQTQMSFTTKPTYNNSIAPMMGTYCTHCHRPDSIDAVDPPLRTYNEVKNAGTVSHLRIQNGTMPPYSPMPDYYKALFAAWRLDSYPEN